MRRVFRAVGLSLSLAVGLTPGFSSASDNWPAQPITWTVGFAPGGSVDVVTRAVAQQVGIALKQTVVVENKPGGSGGIALTSVGRAKPDGYTVITAAGPILLPDRIPSIGKELTAVAAMAEGAVVLVGTPGGPSDFAALTQAIKANPSAFAYASSGIGTGQHIAGEMLNQALGANMVHVPYKGGSQAVMDVMGGQVQLAMLGVSSVVDHVRNGKLIAYAVTTAERAEALPNVPTLREAGLKNFEAAQWYVAAVPADTPQDIVQKLRAAVNTAVNSAEVRQLLAANGFSTPDASTDAAALVAKSLAQANAVAREAKIDLN